MSAKAARAAASPCSARPARSARPRCASSRGSPAGSTSPRSRRTRTPSCSPCRPPRRMPSYVALVSPNGDQAAGRVAHRSGFAGRSRDARRRLHRAERGRRRRGLDATLAALEAGKRVALANKETLVVAGELAAAACARSGGEIVPVDSEHSAILQCLGSRDRHDVRRLIITASGGPFRTWTTDAIGAATLADALRHPTWSMGRKITVDSATLANKALEVIEAHFLFGVPTRTSRSSCIRRAWSTRWWSSWTGACSRRWACRRWSFRCCTRSRIPNAFAMTGYHGSTRCRIRRSRSSRSGSPIFRRFGWGSRPRETAAPLPPYSMQRTSRPWRYFSRGKCNLRISRPASMRRWRSWAP